jgi:glycosyl transferase family 2
VSPRVAVVIPVYNLARFVGEAIESVLAQTLPPDQLEIVVVDDGSTDDSAAVVARYEPRVRVVRQANRGLAAARNAGIRASSAPWLTFLDADDRVLPEKLAAQLALADARPDVGLVYTGVIHVDEDGRPLPQRGWATFEGDVLPRLVLGNLIHPLVALVRRADVDAVGGFDETLRGRGAEDWDLWLRVSLRGVRWGLVDRPLAEYRVRTDGMHQHAGGMAENRIAVLDKLFALPALPDDIRDLRPLAYRRAALTSACEHYAGGDRTGGARWFRAAADAEPGFLTDPEALAHFCRGLLPIGHQRGALLLADLPRLSGILRAALAELFAAPDLPPAVATLRWRSRVAYWQAMLPLLRKRTAERLRGRLRTATAPA